MNYILFDGAVREALLPFTYTRPVADIRVGILTIREKWEKYLGNTITTITEEYLSEKYPMVEMEQNVLINASFLPNEELVSLVSELQENEAVFLNEEVVAFFALENQEEVDFSSYTAIEYNGPVLRIENTWDIFSKNGEALQADFDLLTADRVSQPISRTNTVFNPENIFLEEGASVECSVLNAQEGPIYIGKDALVMEGNLIRGGFALGEKGVVKMGSKIYGPTTVGPKGKVCGEISNSVIFGNSSKGHDGYLGNSVLGEWCNIGADANNSNLKNNYSQVKLWNYETESMVSTGLQFCGLMMGDHSMAGINTMFNTGTVIGVNANVYGTGFPPHFIPSFSWGDASGFTTYQLEKAFVTAKIMMARREVEFDEVEERILRHVFEETTEWRKYNRN
ncbi:UDP-N-acetylglucosamine diphosphorylase/glucosamine-1-phosphate N-acetyltransferase [Arenibacter nanhaiticus]|uniref:UDP-N-acetylglucosamine diphosphorylase/glucosamine-1-phosphate N-acetyltransferase n=1 Tax=Arenibacter nanhaiticus TaxID=558155 RepID=A0A1M6EBN7_9FLAO|nr:GlmU family protein [Arenibacter nanhaiticus]SHI82927.1 UDP-N-acetylglucosamine diphosphorylase/glucosamine-1-phosphate N-acetyltransferase [Arenibacter nanhaiticus]